MKHLIVKFKDYQNNKKIHKNYNYFHSHYKKANYHLSNEY